MTAEGLLIPHEPAAWLLGCYGAVATAMAADFVAGVMKARRLSTPRTSRRFRQTAEKAGRYLLPMVCLSCVDVMVMAITEIPALTIAMGAFNVFCEFRSVMERTHDKAQIARTEETLDLLMKNKDSMAKLLAELLGRVESPSAGSASSSGGASSEASAAESASSESATSASS